MGEKVFRYSYASACLTVVGALSIAGFSVGESSPALVDDASLSLATHLPGVVRRPARAATLGVSGDTQARDANEGTSASVLGSSSESLGIVAYVERLTGWFTTWNVIRLASVEDGLSFGRPIYYGTQEVQSVSVSEDGELVTFSLASDDGDFDIYLIDVVGAWGGPQEVYLLDGGDFDQTHVTMSLDGSVHAWQSFDPESGTTNYVVAQLDRVTGDAVIEPVNVSLGEEAIEQRAPSLSGLGNTVAFVADDDVFFGVFGAPGVVTFSTDGSGGAVAYLSTPDAQLEAPTVSADGTFLLLRETIGDGSELVFSNGQLNVRTTLLDGFDGSDPRLTADGFGYTFGRNGELFRSELDPNTPVAAAPVPVPNPFSGWWRTRASAFWAKPLPPPPPPPPGQIAYEGTTVGGPRYQRPEGTGPALITGDVAYNAFSFTPEISGFFDIVSEQTYDGYLHLYQAPFAPELPLENVLAGNDDSGGNRASRVAIFLDAGIEYVVVTSGFDPVSEGSFVNTITPRPVPGPGELARIEVVTESVRVAGPWETIDYELFASSADDITCSVDFGDGTDVETFECASNATAGVSHVFSEEGFYDVVFTVENAAGTVQSKVFPTIRADNPDQFDIVVVFANDLLTPNQREAFVVAANRWSEVITADLASEVSGGPAIPSSFSCAGEPAFNGFVDDLVISAAGEPIDGPGAVLGSAGPCLIRPEGSNGDKFPLPVYGTMRFDTADLDGLEEEGTLLDVIVHEMGHVLGIGTLWDPNSLLVNGTADGADPDDPNFDPRYVGDSAVLAYQDLLVASDLPAEADVPAANTGGAGTSEGHWREVTFDTELMTGFLNGDSTELSVLTIGGLEDLGYEVNFSAADPYTLPLIDVSEFRLGAPEQIFGYDQVLKFDINKRKRIRE